MFQKSGQRLPSAFAAASARLLRLFLGLPGIAALCSAVPAALSSSFPSGTYSEDQPGTTCGSQSRVICSYPTQQRHCEPSFWSWATCTRYPIRDCSLLALAVHICLVHCCISEHSLAPATFSVVTCSMGDMKNGY